MSSREFESRFESSMGGGDDSGSGLLDLIGKAVLGAMLEDWTAQSLALYSNTGSGLPSRQLPDEGISAVSSLERQLMQQLAGAAYPLDELSNIVSEFLARMVSGTKVLEDEIASCGVVWISRGELADPMFVLAGGS